jgi:hypothetical protein
VTITDDRLRKLASLRGDKYQEEAEMARELLSLRQQAQPTREEGWRVKELEWERSESGKLHWAKHSLGAYHIEELGRRQPHAVRFYLTPSSQTFNSLAEAKAAAQADYASRISSALLPIDAPAHEAGGEVPVEWREETRLLKWADWLHDKSIEGALFGTVTTFESDLRTFAAKLAEFRALLASPAEPAAHSLQTDRDHVLAELRHKCAVSGPCSDNGDGCACSGVALMSRASPSVSEPVACANLIREMAYAAAKFVATDDGYWREQMDYLEGQLRAALVGERPSPIYAEDVAREINSRVKP